MSTTLIKSLYRETPKYLGQNITVAGWVRTSRSSKDFGFIELNDGSFFKGLQIVFEASLNNFSEVEKVSVGSSLEIEGELVESPAAGQAFELKAKKITILSLAPENYPLQKKKHSFEFLRTISHLRGRSNTFSAVFRLRKFLRCKGPRSAQPRGNGKRHESIYTAVFARIFHSEYTDAQSHYTSMECTEPSPRKGSRNGRRAARNLDQYPRPRAGRPT